MAGSITYDQTAGLGGTYAPPDTGSASSASFPFATSLTFPFWNPASFPGSTLQSVVFSLTGDVNGSLTLTNTASSAGSFSGTTRLTLTMTIDSGAGIYLITIPEYSTGSFGLAAGESKTISGLSSGPKTETAAAISTGLSTFIYSGSGDTNYTLPLSGVIANSATWDTTQAPNISGSSNALAYGSVTYNYSDPSPVPEPATMGLMGSALVGLGLVYRRRRRA